MRTKILREPGKVGYPIHVCRRCGNYALEDCPSCIPMNLFEWEFNRCGVCNELTEGAHPRDFGWPTFYTYANGAPVKGGRHG